jgi:molybdate transport system ATP-binding protein
MTPASPHFGQPDRDPLIVSIEDATSVRPGGQVVFRDLSWRVREGETWAVVGPVGSGKTSLGDLLLGQLQVATAAIRWPLLERLRQEGQPGSWPSDVIRRVSFKEESHLFSFSRHYYQQRFNFIEARDDLTLDAFLHAGTDAEEDAIAAVAGQLEIESLRPLSFIKLSNGQIRRALIARALLSRPELLILDEPFVGLDAAGRSEVAALLGELIWHGTRVLLVTCSDIVPEWVTHILELDRLAIRWQGPRRKDEVGRKKDEPNSDPINPFASTPATPAIVEMRDVTVRYGDRFVLQNVSWTVRAGERWAVLGPNGSGKTTLLSLLCGDHPQAYSNDIRLFGRQRGTGESIWDIKRRVGLVSPELHLYFSEPLTAFAAAATGFFDVLAYRPVNSVQAAAVRELFHDFAIAELADRPFARLSTGEQRLVLLARALVKRPPLLILDEPFQGLDPRCIEQLQRWLDQRLGPEQSLLFVSHYAEEIPQSVRRRLRLHEGKIVEIA